MDLKLVKTKKDYEKALKRMEEIFSAGKGTPEFDELEVLGILIEAYEDEHFPIGLPDPIEAIKAHMENNDLKQKDLIKYIGSISKVSEVLNRKRPLSINMIRALHKGLGISLDILIQEYTENIAS